MTVSVPAAFSPGRMISDKSAGSTSTRDGGDETRVYPTTPTEIRTVPAAIRADSRSTELERWSTSGVTRARDYLGDNTPIIFTSPESCREPGLASRIQLD
jgi:hypothetical protein